MTWTKIQRNLIFVVLEFKLTQFLKSQRWLSNQMICFHLTLICSFKATMKRKNSSWFICFISLTIWHLIKTLVLCLNTVKKALLNTSGSLLRLVFKMELFQFNSTLLTIVRVIMSNNLTHQSLFIESQRWSFHK